MKRIISWILAVCLLSSLTACAAPQQGGEANGTTNSNHEGLSVEILEVRRVSDGIVLEVLWKNETDYSVLYGEAFEILRQDNGQWIPLEMKENTAFHSIGYSLEAHSEAQKTYNLGWVYDLSQPGNYRFGAECFLYETPDGTRCTLSADFTLDGACKVPDSDGVPQLILISGSEQVTAMAGGYHWIQHHQDGSVSQTIADAMHPLQCQKYLSNYETTNDTVRPKFSVQPDSWEVRCWPDYMFRDGDVSLYDDKNESVMVYDGQIYLKTGTNGGHVYEITATWNESETQSYGKVTYVVWITRHGAEPLVTEIMPR